MEVCCCHCRCIGFRHLGWTVESRACSILSVSEMSKDAEGAGGWESTTSF